MASDELKIESGRFDWSLGRGYEAPAEGGPPRGGGELPPGWNDVPVFRDRPAPTHSIPQAAMPTEVADLPDAAPKIIQERFRPERQTAREYLATHVVDCVNLADGSALYQGHQLTLSRDGLEAIKMILAAEVCRTLEEEKVRILGTVQFPEMPEPSNREQPNVSEMQGPPLTMDAEATGDGGEMS